MQSCTCKGNKKKWFYGIEICLFSCFSESVVEGGGKGSGMVDFCVFMCWLLWGYVVVVVWLGWWFEGEVLSVAAMLGTLLVLGGLAWAQWGAMLFRRDMDVLHEN